MAMQLLDVVTRDIQLRRISRTNGGEYAGPCPFCGGTDRFRVWPEAEWPGYWCRQCGARGDAIQYLRDKDGLSYRQACAYLGITSGERPRAEGAEARPIALEQDPPSQVWQDRAVQFCHYAFGKLWSAEGAEMLAYLHSRGLQDTTIKHAGLGYNPDDLYDQAARWGLESEHDISHLPQARLLYLENYLQQQKIPGLRSQGTANPSDACLIYSARLLARR